MAGMPAAVAGIFTIRFGRLTARQSRFASRTVPAVSCASVGRDLDAHVAVGAVRAWNTGRNTSAAARMSSMIERVDDGLGRPPGADERRERVVVVVACAIACSKMVGFEVRPVTSPSRTRRARSPERSSARG